MINVIKTIIADDQPIFLKGLHTTLSQNRTLPIKIVAMHSDGNDLLSYLKKHPVDLIIMDLSLKGVDGLETIKKVRHLSPDYKIQVISRYADSKMVKSTLQAGADAYVLKTGAPEELFKSLRIVLEGQSYVGDGVAIEQEKGLEDDGVKSFEEKFVKKYYLTKREIQVLRLITEAKSNKEIAKELYISDQTVSVHRKNIMRKVGVSSTAGLIRMAYDYCLV